MPTEAAPGASGLRRILLKHPDGATAELYLHGAHLTSWIPAGGTEALFLSRAARIDPGTAIRGGVPVIFPQFAGLGPLPKHGFARTLEWEWSGPDADAAPRATLRLRDSPQTLAIWPHPFQAELTAELGARSLAIHFAVTNTGTSVFSCTAALHSYLRVADIHQTRVEGLQGVRYRSAPEGVEDRADPEPVLTVASEIDRIYRDVPAELRVRDGGGGRTLRVRAEGFRDAVVWNPWAELAASLPDMEAEEYREMICVEAAQIMEPITLAPGSTWRGSQLLEASG